MPAKNSGYVRDEAAIAALPGPDRLRAWRKRKGISAQMFARMLGLKNDGSIYQYEGRKLPLTYHRLVQVTALTGIPLGELAWPHQLPVLRAFADAIHRPAAAAEQEAAQ